MSAPKTLIGLQDTAIRALLEAKEAGETNGPRSHGYQQTCLNLRPRTLSRIRTAYKTAAQKLGYNSEQLNDQWQDVKDCASLQYTNAR